MSSSEYWESLNKLLRSENLEFTDPASINIDTMIKLTFKETDSLKKGIQYALNNFNEIAQIEYEFNDGQPVKTTEKHLQWAKVFIESSTNQISTDTLDITSVLNAESDISVGQFLLDCHALVMNNPPEFHIQTDNKRKQLITKLFGNGFTEVILESSALKSVHNKRNISSTQIIFDSADVASAIDELIICLSDRTSPPWRIQSVYVQESLRNVICDTLTKERLNAVSNGSIVPVSDAEQQKIQDLAKRFGGTLLESDNKMIRLLLNVPPKYLQPTENESIHTIPVAINFFRTTKELIQLVKGDFDPKKEHFASVWTENIGLLYEVTAGISAKIVWNNSIGLFDKIMPSLMMESKSNSIARYENISLIV